MKLSKKGELAIVALGDLLKKHDENIGNGHYSTIRNFHLSRELGCTKAGAAERMKQPRQFGYVELIRSNYQLTDKGVELYMELLKDDVTNGDTSTVIGFDETPPTDADEVKFEKVAGNGSIESAIIKMIMPQLKASVKIKTDDIAEQVKKITEEILKRRPKPIDVKTPTGEIKKLGLTHKTTATIIKILETRNVKPLNVMLVGAAGSGKTTACEQAATAHGLKFFPLSVGKQTTKSDLLGYMGANENYIGTVIRSSYENGGLLMLDELDAANPNVLTILNTLLENHYCSFPDKVIKRHENFVCVCCCNTFGRGADRLYVGRNQLDAATLDRFVTINFDYDEQLEREIAQDDNWVDKVQRYRQTVRVLNLRVVISPRASINGAVLLNAGFSESEVEDMVVWKGLPNEQVSKIKGGV